MRSKYQTYYGSLARTMYLFAVMHPHLIVDVCYMADGSLRLVWEDDVSTAIWKHARGLK